MKVKIALQKSYGFPSFWRCQMRFHNLFPNLILNEENGWEIINAIFDKENYPEINICCAIFQTSSKDMLIFGGRFIEYKNDAFKFDTINYSFSKNKNSLACPSIFISTNYIIFKHRYYIADFINYGIHKYNPLTQIWEIYNPYKYK